MAIRRIRLSGRVLLAAVFAVSLAARLPYVLTIPMAQIGRADAREYDDLARAICTGRGFVRQDGRNLFGPRPAHEAPAATGRAPLYPAFLCLLYKVGLGWRGAVVAQAVLDAAGVCVLAWLAAQRWGPRAGLAAGLFGAASPYLIYHTGWLMTETLSTFLVVASLWFWHRSLQRPHVMGAAVLGVCLGAAGMTRPTLLVVGMAFALVWTVRALWGRRRELALVAGMLAAAFVTLTPWMEYNRRTLGVFLPTTTAAQYNVYWGWNPWLLTMYETDDPHAYDRADEAAHRHRTELYEKYKHLPPWERALKFQAEGMRYIREHPWDALRLGAYKFAHFFQPGMRLLPAGRIHSSRWKVAVSWIWGSILFAAALGGALRWARRDGALFAGLFLMVLGAGLMHAMVFSELRYRIPFVEPVAVLYAGALFARAPRSARDESAATSKTSEES